MKVLLAANLHPTIRQEIESAANVRDIMGSRDGLLPYDELSNAFEESEPEIAIVEATEVDEALLDRTKNLRMIVCTRGNPVNIDLAACAERGVVVTNTPHRNANAVAEFTIALMLSTMRRIPQAYASIRAGERTSQIPFSGRTADDFTRKDVIWNEDGMDTMPYFIFRGPELFGKTIGLVGLGAIGQMVGSAASALGMKVIAHDPYFSGDPGFELKFMSLLELAEQADIVSLHAKESAETTGMIGSEFFSRFGPGGYLVNTSRGRLVDRDALLQAIEDGTVSGAALDVFDYEPLSADDPMLQSDKIICTPHIGGASTDVVYHQSMRVWESVEAYLDHKDKGEIPHRVA